MDWRNELWVKLYKRETDDDLLLSWEARALWHEMLKRFDRSGRLSTRRGHLGLAAMVRIPVEVVERVVTELENDGRIRRTDTGYFAPNYAAAQNSRQSDVLRKRESRERERIRNQENQLSHPVTSGHEMSRSDKIRTEEKARPRLSDSVTIRDESAVDLTRRDPRFRYVPSDTGPGRYMIFNGDSYLKHVEERPDGSFVEISD